MSRIDELQRLHEAHEKHLEPDAAFDVEAMAESGMDVRRALHNSWPAIHRVLLALRVAMNPEGCTAEEAHELRESFRALDGDKGAT